MSHSLCSIFSGTGVAVRTTHLVVMLKIIMNKLRNLSYLIIFLIFADCTVNSGNSTGDFYQVSGNTIVKNGKAVMLNGTNICNYALWEWEWDREPYKWYSVE